MANVKLKDGNGVEQTYNGVSKVILKDTNNQDVVFEQAQAGTNKVNLLVENSFYQSISVLTGGAIIEPTNPVKIGYGFVGWGSTSGATQPDINFPLTINNDTNLYAIFNEVIQLKSIITGYGSFSPSSVSFSTNSNLINWTPETINKDEVDFIKIPTMYRKIISASGGQITSFIISSWKEDNDFVPYPVFIDEGGNLMPYVLMSKAKFGQSVPESEGRELCRIKGAGYQMYDWMFQSLWKDLICAKMQTIDTNNGSGISTDVLGITWGNGDWWIDGIASPSSGNAWVFSYKPSKYVDEPSSSTDGYQAVNYDRPTTTGNINVLGYDTAHPFVNYPKSTSGTSYTSNYCDNYGHKSGSHPVSSRVGTTSAMSGAFNCETRVDWYESNMVRLCYRPITQ